MLVEQIDHSRDNCNLSSAIRTFVFNHFRAREKMVVPLHPPPCRVKMRCDLAKMVSCLNKDVFQRHQRVYLSRWAPVQTFGH